VRSLVVAVTLLGLVIRIPIARQPLFADELSTYWIVTEHGLRSLLSTVHSDAEITPPLSFVASWATAHIDHSPLALRLPSLVAGVLSIPATYLVGARTVGRRAGLLAATIVALSPFMIYYSGEARAYSLLMLLGLCSTLAMLLAADTGRARWWVAYAAATCLAVYTHYTAVFLLGAQLLWLLWAHPESRKAAILANAGAVVAFLPWVSGLVNDLTSPTSEILSALSPFTPHDIRLVIEHWLFGYPYTWVAQLTTMPGTVALVLLALAVVVAVAGLLARGMPRLAPRTLLVLLLALSAPIGEALVSLVGTNLFGVRNLAVSWPGVALTLAALLMAAAPRLRLVAAALAIAAFAIGAAKMLTTRYQRPDYAAAARYVDDHARAGDVVVDATGVLSPGPPTALDATLDGDRRVIRAGAPAERDHPFGFGDRVVPLDDAVRQAVAAAQGKRVFVVSTRFPQRIAGIERRTAPVRPALPAPYRLVASRDYPGIALTSVDVFAAP
jgi:mannosyltransferase